MKIVRLFERREVPIDHDLWEQLRAEPGFWELVGQKRIRVTHRGANDVSLAGAGYVGRAVVGGIAIDIAPKIPGALAPLLAHASGGAFRIDPLSSPTSAAGDLLAVLAREFVSAVEAYVERGRDWAYTTLSEAGPLGGGRLDIVRTMRLRARGAPHLLAFRRQVQTRDVPLNRVVAAALGEVEELRGLSALGDECLARARGLAWLFDDVGVSVTRFAERGQLAALAQELLAQLPRGSDSDLLALAGLLLDRQGVGPADTQERLAPRAWFLSLERLFEHAVRSTCHGVLDRSVTLVRGEQLSPRITSLFGSYTANPDLVLFRAGRARIVGDVKYKELETGPLAPDLYQLLVHAAAFTAPEALLVYPGSSFRRIDLGKSVTGCRVWVFELCLGSFDSSIRGMISALASALGLDPLSPERAT